MELDPSYDGDWLEHHITPRCWIHSSMRMENLGTLKKHLPNWQFAEFKFIMVPVYYIHHLSCVFERKEKQKEKPFSDFVLLEQTKKKSIDMPKKNYAT